MKASVLDEIKESELILKLLNSTIININNFTLPYENSQRNLVKIQKNDKTSQKYPRKFDKIKNCK